MEEFFKKTRFDDHSTKRVSFILTTKNRPDFLEAALERTRALVKPEDELIIIDGESDIPRVFEVVDKFKDLIDIFISEPDDSLIHGFNKGVLLAHGKYIKHITDDDAFYPEAMERAIDVLESNSHVDFLVCGGTKKNFQTGKTRFVYVKPGTNYGKHPDDVRYGANGSGMLMRRNMFAKVGFPITKNISDHEIFMISVANGANVKFCRINLYENIVYPHGHVMKYKREVQEDAFKLYKQYASLAFRLQFMLKVFCERHWPLNIIRKSVKRFPKKAIRFLKKRLGFKVEKEPYIWDGGFS